MKANKVTVEDIRAIGSWGTLTVELPSYQCCRTAANLVNYVRKSYPRNDGLSYYTRIIGSTVTIGVTDTDRINRKMSAEDIQRLQQNMLGYSNK